MPLIDLDLMQNGTPNLDKQFNLNFRRQEKVYIDIIDAFESLVRAQEIRVRENRLRHLMSLENWLVSEQAATDYENIYVYSRARLHDNRIRLARAKLDYTNHLLSLWAGGSNPTDAEFDIHLELKKKVEGQENIIRSLQSKKIQEPCF